MQTLDTVKHRIIRWLVDSLGLVSAESIVIQYANDDKYTV
jgi:hypothetical protein